MEQIRTQADTGGHNAAKIAGKGTRHRAEGQGRDGVAAQQRPPTPQDFPLQRWSHRGNTPLLERLHCENVARASRHRRHDMKPLPIALPCALGFQIKVIGVVRQNALVDQAHS